jgi:hypothetical protein
VSRGPKASASAGLAGRVPAVRQVSSLGFGPDFQVLQLTQATTHSCGSASLALARGESGGEKRQSSTLPTRGHGAYDVALLDPSGAELFRTSATAKLEDHIVVLRADVDLAGVSPGSYFLGLRQPGLEWMRFPIRVL